MEEGDMIFYLLEVNSGQEEAKSTIKSLELYNMNISNNLLGLSSTLTS